jgi:dihydroorotate dehydrogenase electron transfer subunit
MRAPWAPEAVRTPFVEVPGEVVQNGLLPGTRLYWALLRVPAAFPEPTPGQFVMAAPNLARAAGQLLPRPFSIARAVREGDGWILGILYSRIGRGTDLMARATSGTWTVLGPLGRGFDADGKGKALLVGGGRGTAPLVFLAEWLEARGRGCEFLVGARGRADWAGPLEMGAELTRSRIWSATEDGSIGYRGRVLELFAQEPELAEALATKNARIHACGPHGLLAAVGAMGAGFGIPVDVSIEAHMACGTGICRSCMVPRDPKGPRPRKGQNPEYLVSCLEGPVVPAACVDWARDRDATPKTPYVPLDEDVLEPAR